MFTTHSVPIPARRLAVTAATLLSALAMSAGAFGQAAIAPQPAQPAQPPKPAIGRAYSLLGGDHSDDTNWNFVTNDNGNSIAISIRKGEVVDAKMNGKPIPPERIKRENGKIKVLDEHGDTLVEHELPDFAVRPRVLTLHGGVEHAYGQGLSALAPMAGVEVQPIEPPKVMIGVQMVEPDSSLRGHLGLEPGQATMISAVYEGLPAGIAGLEPYDIIIAVEGKEPAGEQVVRETLRSKNAGETVRLRILHRGQPKDIEVKLDAYDAEKFQNAKVRSVDLMQSWRQVDEPLEALAWAGQPQIPDNYKELIRERMGGSGGQNPFWMGLRHGDPNAPQVFVPGNADQSALLEQLRAQVEASRAMMDEQRVQMAELLARAKQQAEQARRGAGAAGGAAGAATPDDRMDRLERMIERLMEQRAKEAEEGKAGGKNNS